MIALTPREWRKNRNPESATVCGSSDKDGFGFGVDLNRNFGHHWSDSSRTATDPCHYNYHGSEAFSEPESRAIKVPEDGYLHSYLKIK